MVIDNATFHKGGRIEQLIQDRKKIFSFYLVCAKSDPASQTIQTLINAAKLQAL